ncbi:hypothetical protein LWI29_012984 [Acer saccharum]|uniref:Uncharacterized protein n=1 Tax=Acer saccharum TaxID=4024 RepID=A0AA39SAU5_ACESA|nr:hypothetical protein LWI29_012984 [Acer saccharum]
MDSHSSFMLFIKKNSSMVDYEWVSSHLSLKVEDFKEDSYNHRWDNMETQAPIFPVQMPPVRPDGGFRYCSREESDFRGGNREEVVPRQRVAEKGKQVAQRKIKVKPFVPSSGNAILNLENRREKVAKESNEESNSSSSFGMVDRTGFPKGECYKKACFQIANGPSQSPNYYGRRRGSCKDSSEDGPASVGSMGDEKMDSEKELNEANISKPLSVSNGNND